MGAIQSQSFSDEKSTEDLENKLEKMTVDGTGEIIETQLGSYTIEHWENIILKVRKTDETEEDEFLTLDNMNLVRIQKEVFKDINISTLSVKSNKLELEECNFMYLEKLSNLSLKGNKFPSLKASHFVGLENIQSLDLSECGLTNLTANIFDSLPNLFNLELGGNELTALDGIFNGLGNLRRLNLENNEIIDLPIDIFLELKKLDYLNLSGNKIDGLKNGTFIGLGLLSELNVERNSISNIEIDALTPMKNLLHLYLNDNPTKLKAHVFLSLSRLISLHMSHCQVAEEFEIGTLAGLRSLVHLDLSYNYIVSLPSMAFQDSPFIEKLFLNRNQIFKIEKGAFYGLKLLKKLNLSNNELQDIPYSALNYLESLTELELAMNPIKAIDASRLGRLENLKSLNVSDCQISCIRGYWTLLKNIRNVNIDNNLLDHLKAIFFHGLPEKCRLSMKNNKIQIVDEEIILRRSIDLCGNHFYLTLSDETLRRNRVAQEEIDRLNNARDLARRIEERKLQKRAQSLFTRRTQLQASSMVMDNDDIHCYSHDQEASYRPDTAENFYSAHRESRPSRVERIKRSFDRFH